MSTRFLLYSCTYSLIDFIVFVNAYVVSHSFKEFWKSFIAAIVLLKEFLDDAASVQVLF